MFFNRLPSTKTTHACINFFKLHLLAHSIKIPRMIRNPTNTFINFLVIGYASIIIMLAISAGIFFNYEQNISNSFKTYSDYNASQKNIDALFNAATQRSILMVRMINADDLFDVDELNMEMHKYQFMVSKNILALENAIPLEEQMTLLKQVRDSASENLDYQEKVYQHLMEGDKQAALKQLVDITLPTQRKVFDALNLLKSDYAQKASEAKTSFANIIADMRDMILMVSLPLILGMFFIAILTIKRLKRFAHAQESLLANLEEIVSRRTQELLMDRNLMQNINEAIGVFDAHNHLKITNKKLSELIQQNQLSKTESVWNLLEALFTDMESDKIQLALHHQGVWRGESALREHGNQYFIIDLALIEDESLSESLYSIALTDITELKRIQNQLEYSAHYDAVTQLPNRYSFNRKIDDVIKRQAAEPFHLFYLDLDDFKWVNDHLGHAAGDLFLKEVGQIFKETVPFDHFIARIGGDEFAIIVMHALQSYELANLANQLLVNLKKVNKRHSAEHEVGCSIGVATYPMFGKTPEVLLKNADYAMYQAKKEGHNQFCIFSGEMREQLKYLHEIEQNLRRAVKEAQFEVFYQPQYSLHTQQLVGAEALIRWPTPQRMIPPGEFIPLAEKFSLINDIGEFVFNTAAKQLNQWSNTQKTLPRIAINASSIQLLSGNFGDFVEQVIHDNQLTADRIDIEVTESVMMKNIERNEEAGSTCLSRLQEKGLEISIDDFGTGYSSLSYIKHLNVDRIKIDKSFIDDIEFKKEARSIVKAIIKMGHSLGLKVLAEGIETPNQLDILKSLECDEGQGFLFSKPLPADKFEIKCLS